MLRDLGFIIGYKGAKGYIKLEHPDLVVEFLSPDKGRGIDKPVSLPQFKLNAQALRFLSFLAENTIKVKVEGFFIVLPHPVNFALHKLIISGRRVNQEKAMKDKDTATGLLKALIQKGEQPLLRKTFRSLPKTWQKKITQSLGPGEYKDILMG